MSHDAADDAAPGVARVRRLVDHERPTPGLWRTLGMRPVTVDPGRARVEVALGERHSNGSGVAHGGLVAAVVDSACGAAMATTVPDGQRIATVDLQIAYHRPVPLRGHLVAVATVEHAGRRIGHVTCEVSGSEGRAVATGRAVFAVLPREADEAHLSE